MQRASNGRFWLGALAWSLAAWFTGCTRSPTQTAAEPAPLTPVAVELQPLQGTWQGVVVGDKSGDKITITITGDSFHFHRDTNFWFETTITLPSGTNPQQFRATIKGCPPSQASSLGKVVAAVFKIEDGTLTVAARGDDDDETPKGFEGEGMTLYQLQKVQTEPPKSK